MRDAALIIETAAARSPSGRATRTLDTVAVWGLGVLLMFAVLAFGAVEPWSIFVVESGAAVLFLAWAAGQAFNGKLTIAPNPLYLPMLAFAALVAIQALGVSAYPYATRTEALRYVAYGLMFFIAAQSLNTATRRRLFLLGMATFGFGVAVLGIAQHFTAPGKIYWRIAPVSGSVFGPYVNHNHFAGLMELLVPIPIVFALNRRRTGGQRALLAFAAIVMAVSLFLSGSRGGMAAFVAEMAVLAAYLARSRATRPAAWRLGGLAVVIAAALFWLDTGAVTNQLKSLQTPLSPAVSGNRLTIARDSLRMFRDRPVLGWGLDTFPVIYSQYRSFATDVFINAAHNDYVQLLTETGLAGIAVLAWFLWALFRAGLRAASTDRAQLAALLGVCGILVHSLTDFNPHIPANAAIFYVMCAAASSKNEGLTH